MKHYLFFLLTLSFILASCNDDDPMPEPEPEPSVFKFTYSGQYEMSDINLYVGPNGDKIETDQSYLGQYWEDIEITITDTLIIDLEKDSLYLKDEYSTIRYGITNASDSIFVKYNNDTFGFFGVFSESKSSFDHYKCFYIRVKMPRPELGIYGGYVFHKGSEYGIGTYSDHFYENFFKSPENMTKEGDKVLWSNFKFEYKQITGKSK